MNLIPPRSIYEYDVDVRLTNPNTKQVTTVMRRELAYSVMDAWTQAYIAVVADAGSAEVKVTAVRPSDNAVQAAATRLKETVQDMLARTFTQALDPKGEEARIKLLKGDDDE